MKILAKIGASESDASRRVILVAGCGVVPGALARDLDRSGSTVIDEQGVAQARPTNKSPVNLGTLIVAPMH